MIAMLEIIRIAAKDYEAVHGPNAAAFESVLALLAIIGALAIAGCAAAMGEAL